MNTMDGLVVVIMAGGLGKRMQSDLPKVLHTIGDEPMLVRIVRQARQLKPHKICIVVGQYFPIIQSTLQRYFTMYDIEFVFQANPLGTGHALQCCIGSLSIYPSSDVLILSGDVPLLTADTMFKMTARVNHVKIMTTILDNPTGYGRIVENSDGIFHSIVEEKDCDDEQREIQKVNCGIYAFECSTLCKYLPMLQNNNSQGEYYLTDLIEIIRTHENVDIAMLNMPTDKQIEIMGVNTKQQLEELNDMAAFI